MYKEISLDEKSLERLIELSIRWQEEDSCRGYRKNEREDIEGNRIFVYEEDGEILAYLFGHVEESKKTSVADEGSKVFEVEEIYVVPERRNRGIGSELFRFAEDRMKDEAEYVMLSSATKNYKAIMHFYIDELGMEFWNVRLFKKMGE